MTDDFGIWEVDEAEKTAHPLKTAGSAGTEALLEDILAQNPDMLMPDLQLVGRQLPAANGALDLLGVDSEGRLVVFELKREKLRREAVAQAVDYASWLESLDATALGELIAENSGQRGINKIEDFKSWYEQRWESIDSLKSIKIVLVGLGADDPARRMADWLARKGVEIDLLTFLGFHYEDRMLLARQIESGEEAQKQERRIVSRRATTREERRHAIESKIDEYEMRSLWEDVCNVFSQKSTLEYLANSAITFRKGGFGWYKIEIMNSREVRIVFFPKSVDLCLDKFENMKDVIPFNCEPLSNAPPTERVSEQWFCRLDKGGWNKHKDRIAELVRTVDEQRSKPAEQPPP